MRPGLSRKAKETRTLEGWGYTNKARLRGLTPSNQETRTLEGWGYTNEARLRGLKRKILKTKLGIRRSLHVRSNDFSRSLSS
ncbi:MAG: hypothetical protein ACRC8Y_22480 [Chroococcales cyanobacterium]